MKPRKPKQHAPDAPKPPDPTRVHRTAFSAHRAKCFSCQAGRCDEGEHLRLLAVIEMEGNR